MYLKMRAHKPTYLLSTVWTTKIEKKNDVKFDFYVIEIQIDVKKSQSEMEKVLQ